MEERQAERVHQWLNDRGISDDVIARYEIGWNEREIVIPVHDKGSKILFNKYRRSPFLTEGPKYRYEKGAEASLFGVRELSSFSSNVVVCEGELDALALISAGFAAVSTTGGSSTFKEEWVDLLKDKKVFVCYDSDDAGIKGAFKLQNMMPEAKLIFLPKDTKDVTEYLLKYGADEFEQLMMLKAKSYPTILPWDRDMKKNEMQMVEKHYKEKIDELMLEARRLRELYMSDLHLQILIQMFMTKLGEVKRSIKYFTPKRKDMGQDRLKRAKAVPIPVYVKFNSANMGRCVWHDDKNPSMYYYEKQNKVYCFACSKGGDLIDIMQELHHCNLSEAIRIILND